MMRLTKTKLLKYRYITKSCSYEKLHKSKISKRLTDFIIQKKEQSIQSFDDGATVYEICLYSGNGRCRT